MSIRITQCNVAPTVTFFKKGIMDRYNFSEYTDINEPTFFFGVQYAENIQLINNHKGLKFVYPISPGDETCVYALDTKNLFLFDGPFIDKNVNAIRKKVEIEFKDYSMFTPNPLGDKIYSYMRDVSEFGYGILNEIQRKINFEIMYGGMGVHTKTFLPIHELKEKYYDKTFLNINLSGKVGFTTVRELGLMGRKTIMNSSYNFPSEINYTSIDNIIELINQESKKIGTIQPSMNPHVTNDDWLYLDFWYK